MIFPALENKKFGYINLDLEARKWIANKKFEEGANPLLHPDICQEMVNNVNKKYNLDFSYGGWMENRSFVWRGSYLDKNNAYIHLGLDLNVPAGTEIMAAFDAEAVRIDDDYPEEHGWGTRVFLKHQTEPIYLIYAHLDREIDCKVGDFIKKGRIFAKVGKPPFNGNWFEHTHLQVILEGYYQELALKNSWKEFDGYGAEREIKRLAKEFPDPIKFVF